MKMRIACLSVITGLLFLEAYFLIDAVDAALGLNSPISIFWLDVYSIQIKLSLTCILIPISIILVIFTLLRRKEPKFGFFVIVLFILIFANVIGFLALPSGIARYTRYEGNLSFQGRFYLVTQSYAVIGLADAHPYLDLYECDALGFLCQKIFRYEWKFLKPTIEWSENHQWQSKLVSDPAEHTITLQINGETVYVYPVK